MGQASTPPAPFFFVMIRVLTTVFQVALLVLLMNFCGAGVAQTVKPSSTGTPRASTKAVVGQDATKLAESGRCREALPLLKQVVARTSSKEEKRHALIDGVRCALSLDQRATAGEFLGTLAQEFHHDPEALYVLVHGYSDLSTRASQDLAITASGSPQAHELNAEALELQGKWDDAEKEYKLILAKHPAMPGIHFRLGRLLLSRPNPTPDVAEKAKVEFRKELEIDANNAGAEYILGELAREESQLSEAAQHFARAAKLDEGMADAYLGLGISLISDGKAGEAVTPLETYVRLQPDNPAGHYHLALAYTRTGRKEDARREATLQKQALDRIEQAKQKAAGPVPQPSAPTEQSPERPK